MFRSMSYGAAFCSCACWRLHWSLVTFFHLWSLVPNFRSSIPAPFFSSSPCCSSPGVPLLPWCLHSFPRCFFCLLLLFFYFLLVVFWSSCGSVFSPFLSLLLVCSCRALSPFTFFTSSRCLLFRLFDIFLLLSFIRFSSVSPAVS